jgi:hypothetical protein
MVKKLHDVGVRKGLNRRDLVTEPAIPRGIKHALQNAGLPIGARLVLY